MRILMNSYGNKIGYHNPELSEKSFNKIQNDTGLNWDDCSWHHDLCDSIIHVIEPEKKFISVYIPNSKVFDIDNEKFNTYCVLDEWQSELLNTENIEKVISFINKYIKERL